MNELIRHTRLRNLSEKRKEIKPFTSFKSMKWIIRTKFLFEQISHVALDWATRIANIFYIGQLKRTNAKPYSLNKTKKKKN